MDKDTENLPEWFCLIQTDRNYFIKRYYEIQDGQKPINRSVFGSFILQNMWYLFYRKYALLPLFLYGIVSGILIAPMFILDPFLKIYFKNNMIKIQGVEMLFTALILFFVIKSVSKSYDTWYFEKLKDKYNKGYRPHFYHDTSPFLKYFSFFGMGAGTLLAFYFSVVTDSYSLYFMDILIEKIKTTEYQIKSLPPSFIFLNLYSYFQSAFVFLTLVLRGLGSIFDWIKLKRHKNETTLLS